jgi:hypothetical protein
MQIKETISVLFPGSVESPPLEDVVVLVDRAGVALGVQHAFTVTQRRRIPCADVVAGANTWRPVQRWSS